MAVRKKPNEERSLPCGNFIVYYPIRITLSGKRSEFEVWKKLLKDKGKTISSDANKWLLNLFEVNTWEEWKRKNKNASKQIDNFIKMKLDEQGLGGDNLSELYRQHIKEEMEKDES